MTTPYNANDIGEEYDAERDAVIDVVDDVDEPTDDHDVVDDAAPEFGADDQTPDEVVLDDHSVHLAADGPVPTQGALPLAVRTGDADVDAAVARLAVLDGLPIDEHADVFTDVHRALQDALVDLDRS